MRKLERKWSEELAVVGVHSPKFVSERETEAVRAAILRLNVGHPVVNDRDFRVWQAYAVRAWPMNLLLVGCLLNPSETPVLCWSRIDGRSGR